MPETRTPNFAGKSSRRTGRRDRGRRTQRRLLDAGLRCFAEKGYQAVRVDDIVQAAETSRGTFYLYFPDKEALLRTLAVECTASMTKLINELGQVEAGSEGFLHLRRWLDAFFANYAKYGPVIRAWLEDQATDPLLLAVGNDVFSDIADRFVLRIHESTAHGSVDPAAAAVAWVAMIERFAYFLTSRELPFDHDEILDTLARIMQRGLLRSDNSPAT
jgi:AcrR family transcriptional regulator